MTFTLSSSPKTKTTAKQRLLQRISAPRIAGLDLARALAILGMIAAHTLTREEDLFILDPSSWGGVVEGRPSLLFALLGGISLALMTGRTQPPSAQELPSARLGLLGRATAIFLIGLVLEQLSTGVLIILPLYALLYLLLLPFLTLAPRALFRWSLGLALLGPLLLALLRGLFPNTIGSGLNLLLQPSYSLAAWTSLMLLGLGLGRTIKDWFAPRLPLLFLGLGLPLTLLGYGIGFIFQKLFTPNMDDKATPYQGYPGSSFQGEGSLHTPGGSSMGASSLPAEASQNYNAWPDYLTQLTHTDWSYLLTSSLFEGSPHSGSSAEILGSGGFALIVIGLSLLATRFFSYLLYPLVALGSMPLTAYSAHVLLIFLLVGPGGSLNSPLAFLSLALGIMLFASIYLLFRRQGPLETLAGRASRWAQAGNKSPGEVA